VLSSLSSNDVISFEHWVVICPQYQG
jgi:hypothetical protein